MKTVGILTMHRVLNYGSALQAYATQEIVNRLGYKAEIIDYIYPNKQHKKKYNREYFTKIFRFFLHLLRGFPYKKKKRCFQKFWYTNYQLSSVQYQLASEILQNPPVYDIYLAGSDQIWNPKHIVGDETFLLNFVPLGKKCISYASSMAQKSLSVDLAATFKSRLSRFSAISVRESNGAQIIRDIINREAIVCLDPTLLLLKEDYLDLSLQSSIKLNKPYILVYILQYAYSPYPYVTHLIEEAHKQTGLSVVCLDFSAKQHLSIKDKINLHDSVGPSEFLYLFMNASMVITSSFHGTAFALNFGKSVYSIVDDCSDSDDRMSNLLKLCDMSDRIIRKNSVYPHFSLDINTQIINDKLNKERQKSIKYLEKNL